MDSEGVAACTALEDEMVEVGTKASLKMLLPLRSFALLHSVFLAPMLKTLGVFLASPLLRNKMAEVVNNLASSRALKSAQKFWNFSCG